MSDSLKLQIPYSLIKGVNNDFNYMWVTTSASVEYLQDWLLNLNDGQVPNKDKIAYLQLDPNNFLISIFMYPFNINNLLEYKEVSPYPQTKDITFASRTVEVLGPPDIHVRGFKVKDYLHNDSPLNNFGVLNVGYLDLNTYKANFTYDFDEYKDKFQLFLPFCGFVDIQLNVFDFRYLGVDYIVNLDDGTCEYIISGGSLIQVEEGGEFIDKYKCERVVLTGNFNIGIEVPLCKSDIVQYLRKRTMFNDFQTANTIFSVLGNLTSIKGLMGGVGSIVDYMKQAAELSMEAGDIYHPQGHSVSDTILASYIEPKVKIIHYKHDYREPSNFNALYGRPSEKVTAIKNITSGSYLSIRDVHTDGLTCTKEEKDEIVSLLKNGVIV